MATKPKLPIGMNDPDKVRRFQTSKGLKPDGIWGPKTASAYNGGSNGGNWLDPGSRVSSAMPTGAVASPKMTDRGTNIPAVRGDNSGPGINWGKIGSVAESLAPFASNIVNQFRRPPAPKAPTLANPVTLQGVDYSADRAQVDSTIRGAGLAADRNLSGNTATAVRSSNLARELEAKSRINQSEANQNAEINNRETMINSEIGMRNNQLVDGYNANLTEMQIADQNQKGANFANAADKFIAISNQDKQRALEEKKFAITSRMFDQSGVLNRFMTGMQKDGIEDPTNTKRLSRMYKLGGKIGAY